jgi:hypothetical protein
MQAKWAGQHVDRRGKFEADTYESSRLKNESGMASAIEASSQNGPDRRMAGGTLSSDVSRL